MENSNWVREQTPKSVIETARKLAENRLKWKKEQIKQGKKEVRIPHPDLQRTFIIRYI